MMVDIMMIGYFIDCWLCTNVNNVSEFLGFDRRAIKFIPSTARCIILAPIVLVETIYYYMYNTDLNMLSPFVLNTLIRRKNSAKNYGPSQESNARCENVGIIYTEQI